MTESARDEALRLAADSGFSKRLLEYFESPSAAAALCILVEKARQRPGWVWVPKQWTTAMAHAGYLEAEKAKAEGRYIACAECGEIYIAMIAAAQAEQLLTAAPKPGEGT